MKCNEAASRLSFLVDDMLEAAVAAKIERHLVQCAGCRTEYERLVKLREGLRSLERIDIPEFFPDLVRIRIASARKETWISGLRAAWEYRWSRIRTTEASWYWTRVFGTVCSFLFFFSIYAVLSQFHVGLQPGSMDRGGMSQSESEQVFSQVLKNLGMLPVEAQRRPVGVTNPDINGLYLLNFGQSAVQNANDDTVSVVAAVDRMGGAKIRSVLDYPADISLLTEFSSMISSARCRPARHNGRAVDSVLVLTFSRISVYD